MVRFARGLFLKLSNKAALSLRSLSKCSFTLSKLRFFELRKPKISSCYTTSHKKGVSRKLIGHAHLLYLQVCNLLIEGSRCCADKEIRLDGTYLAYFPFSLMIEVQQMLPYLNKF